MGVNKQIFGSNSERKNFYKLSRQWGKQYRIYHNLPFLNVFNPKDLFDYTKDYPDKFELSEVEFNRLKKTSIDYTLCDENDNPLVCIEFDGLQEGFNIGTNYHTDFPSNPWRKEITELKLKVAHGSNFPFFVLASNHFKDLANDIELAIVDGIIGEVFTRKALQERFREGFDPQDIGYSKSEFESLDQDLQYELIQDWVIGIEVEKELENNPMSKKCSQLRTDPGIDKYCRSHSIQPLSYPDLGESNSLEERIKKWDSILYFGTKYVLHSEIFEDIEVSVWLPNFKSPYYSGLGLTEEVAELVALNKAIKLIKNR